MSRYLFTFLFIMTLQNSSAQTLDKYADQLYYGMLSLKPDSSISDFLVKNVPVVFKKYDSKVKWTAYPLDSIDETKFQKVTDSYIFSSHPYFNGKFKSGQLTITQKIYSDRKLDGNISNIKLWFEFESEVDAKKAFNQLVDTFSTFNVLKRITTQNGIDKAEFTDKYCDKYYNSITIILMADDKLRKQSEKPQEIITNAAYKIFIEVGNDLY